VGTYVSVKRGVRDGGESNPQIRGEGAICNSAFRVPTSTIQIESEDGDKDFTEGPIRLCSPKWRVVV
jgi:hypothetical protein